MRIGEIVQPAWSRTAATLAETTTGFAAKLHPVIGRAVAISQDLTAFLAALLSPAALISLALGIWRLGADLGWTDEFVISNGLFSHWQVWIVLAIALQTLSSAFSFSKRKSGPSEQA